MKYISVIGDSISTYENYIPDGYHLYYDAACCRQNGITGVRDMWWAQVIDAMGGTLCVNNSFSGSRVTGLEFPAACCDRRVRELANGTHAPDAVLLYIGYNDFGGCVPLCSDGKNRSLLCFDDAYEQMLTKIRTAYPAAKIICATLMPTYVRGRENEPPAANDVGEHLDVYNQIIRDVADRCGVWLAELDAGARCETLDGLHPTINGHAAMANAWLHAITQNR